MSKAILVVISGALVATAAVASEPADPQRGAALYRACAACHSLVPGQHRTGPSLGDVWNRKAGTADGFSRYSPPLSDANFFWDAESLNAWLRESAAVVPGNWMVFPGIAEDRDRADLIAFLRLVSADPPDSDIGGMLTDLGALPASQRIASIRHCGDTYRVTTQEGATLAIWEFNLRIKTDSSALGPAHGVPVLLSAGMRGDRFAVIFRTPEEISAFIQVEC